MFGQKKFRREFIVSSNPFDYGSGKKSTKKTVHVAVETRDLQRFIVLDIYLSSGQNIGTGTTQANYELAVANEDDVVILCKNTYDAHREDWHLHALEIIKNVDKNYLKKTPKCGA